METNEKRNETLLIQELTNRDILINDEVLYKLTHYISDFDIFLERFLNWLDAFLKVRTDISVLTESLLVDFLLYERKEWLNSMEQINRDLTNLKDYTKRR